jgi:hypothetical protein
VFTANPTKLRRRMAGLIDRILGDLASPWVIRTSRSVYRPVNVAACAPSLQRINAQLCEESQDISLASLAELREFLTNSCDSPLWGRHPSSARWEAERLLSALVQTHPSHDTVTDRDHQPPYTPTLDTGLNA